MAPPASACRAPQELSALVMAADYERVASRFSSRASAATAMVKGMATGRALALHASSEGPVSDSAMVMGQPFELVSPAPASSSYRAGQL